jgi:hypothetical protein
MAFDPDAYLAEGGGVETAASFDPDAYLGTQQPTEEEGFLRQAADIPVNIFKGGVTGVRMVTDVFGASNPVSKSLAGVEDYMDTLLSAQAKQDQQEIARILKDAEDKGVLDQVVAGVEAFSVAPADTLANAFGTMIPVLATGLAGSVARLAPVAIKGVQFGLGVGMGAGTAKGEIYNAVYSELENQGYDPETASKVASEAQAYNGKNLDTILLNAGLGGLAASTGAEKILTNVITKSGGKLTGGAIEKALKGGITEGGLEGLQGGTERGTTNIALQREGVDVPTMRGVVAQATMEGVAGLGMGAAVGPLEPSLPDDVREQRNIERDAAKVARELSVDPNDANARGIVNETNRLEQKIENNKVMLSGMEPTSREHQRLSLEIAEDQKNLAALKGAVDKLSEPIAAAEAEQARLAREIAAPVEEAVTPPVEPAAAPVSEPITPTIREVPETSPIVGAEPTAVVEQEPVAPAEEAEFAELNDLMERRGQAQSKVKGVKFSKKDEARYKELLPKYRSRFIETVTPESDPVVWKDIEGNDIKVSQKGTFYTVENGRVRTGPAFQSEGFVGDVSPQPVPAAVVESNNVPLPEGYTKQGDVYVYQAPVAETPAVAPAAEVAPAIEPLTDDQAETIRDVITLRKSQGREPNPEQVKRLAEYDARKAGVEVQAGDIISNIVVGHPLFEAPQPELQNLVPIKIQNKEQLASSIRRTEEVRNKAQSYIGQYQAEQAKAKTAPQKKAFAKKFNKSELDRQRDILDYINNDVMPELDRMEKVAPSVTPAVSETITPAAEPAGIAVGNRIKLGKSPQTYTIEEVIPQTETERELGEQYYSVKNEKTGEVQTVEAKDIKPVKAKGARKVAARVKDESLVVPEQERYTFEQAQAEATKLFGGMPEGFVIVNDSVDPEFEFKAAYEPSTGNIILNLAYIRQGESVRNLIAHELGHYAAGDPEIRAKLQEFLDALPPATRAKLERFVERVYNDETGDIRLEEKQVRAFVQMLKTGDQRNAFQKLLDAIKKWLNDNLGTNFQPTDMDAAAVLSGAVDKFRSGEKIAREDGEMRRDTELSQMDADYLDAVERGDMETAQKMVDEAAKAAGYDIGPVYHGTKTKFTAFDKKKVKGRHDLSFGFHFTSRLGEAVVYATDLERAHTFLRRGGDIPLTGDESVLRSYIKTDRPLVRDTDYNAASMDADLKRPEIVGAIQEAEENGNPFDSVIINRARGDEWDHQNVIVFNPEQIKSADPVTYDDAGNVIPLSQRFQPTQKDIRYAKVERSEDVEKDIAIAKQIQSVVDETIGKMPQDQARDYNAFVNEGKSEAQIAEENNTSVSQVRTNIVRGKKAVGDAIKKAKIDTKAKPENVVLEWTTGAAKKYLTKEGDLPGGTFQNWVRRNAKLAREAEEARQATQDFYEGLRKLYKINKIKFILDGLSSIPPEDVARFNDALAGEIPISDMPVEIQEPLTRMRQHIDAMSSDLIATGQLPEYLEAKAMNNLGVYLTRSYKIFSDPKWIDKIPQDKLNAARNFLYQQQSKTDPNFTIEDADRKLEQMLNDWAGEKDMDGKRGGRLGAKDLSVMMTRSEVPKQLRDVMGENTNVIFNYANTISKISRFVADQQFLDAVKKEGAGSFLFTKDNAPKGFNTLIAPEESRTMSPLSGLRTTPEIAKAFEEFGKAYDAKANPALYAFGWLNAVGKANLTVGSLFTQARNLIGQPFFFLANGHADLRAINREVERIMKSKGLSKDQARNELVKMAAGEGLVNENAYAGELKEAFEQIGLKTFEDMDADEFSRQFVLLRLFKKGTQGAQKVYQKTDEIGKLIGWLNETNRIQKMNPSMSREDAMAIASERTRNTYPTYSQGSEALRLFRRQPFFGPFATFFYETFRTTYWNARYAFEDINSGTKEGKEEGIKRLAGTMAQISIGAFLVNSISAMVSGIGDQEEEDVRRMLPPWAANASLVWFPKTKDGVYDFINFSSLNPYNALTDPFVRMMSGFSQGEDPTDIFIESVGTFLAPFTSEQPVTAATVDALRNVTERGTKVYNDEDDLSTKTSKILLHIFGKAFTPGTVDRLRKRIVPAIYGETVGTRAPAPLKEIGAEFTGVRFENMDMRQAFQNKAWEFNKAQNDSERIFRDVATRRRRVTEEDQIEAYRRAEESRFENWQKMYRNYMAVRRAGASKQEAVRLMTDIKISKREASYIARGKYVPYEVSDEVKRRSKLNGNVVPLQEIKAIAREMPRVLEDVR